MFNVETDYTTREISSLRRCMNDLVSILALPAIWAGHDSSRVATTLLDVLVRVLDLDFGYVRASDVGDGSPREWTRTGSYGRDPHVEEIARVLTPFLADHSIPSTPAGLRIANPVADGTASIAVFNLGIQDSVGVFVAGSRRSEFPTETECVLLQVATNQAAIAVQEARRIAQIERTCSKAALQESEERFRQMAESIPEMIQLIIDSTPALIHTALPDGNLDFFNQTWLKYVGLSLEDIEGWRWTAAIHPSDVEEMVNRWRASLANGEPFVCEARVRRADGEYRWMLHHKIALRDERGKIIKWYGSSIDIEDRKRAEEEIKRLKDRLQRENIALREEIDRTLMFEEIVGNSAPLHAVLSDLSKVAPTDSTVLITGETGTGKELVARAIHRRSQRSARAFVSVNCAAIPPSLIASELFGHEKGAFTGAVQRRQGRFELADGGTIFLDEVGELPPEIQMALLRILQEREFERVGSNKPIRVNVRVIAASNRDLETAVGERLFRADLFYRLNVFPLEVPPLRERRADIPLLVEYFAHRFAVRAGKNISSIDKKALSLLQSYNWPGNIRELQNVVERAVIVSDSEMLSIDERWLSGPRERSRAVTAPNRSERVTREKDTIEAALMDSQGRVAGPFGAALRMGLPPSTLESKIKALNIDKSRFRRG